MLTGLPSSGAGAIALPLARATKSISSHGDDIPAQAALAELLSTDAQPHNGVIEDYIQDRRLRRGKPKRAAMRLPK